MSWRKVAAYAAALLAAQFTIGFIEGAFAPIRFDAALAGYLASFILCGGIFAHLSARQTSKPLAHAFAALAIPIAFAVVLSQALAGWLGSTSIASVAVEWLVLICALLAGTAAGSFLRRSTEQHAEA